MSGSISANEVKGAVNTEQTVRGRVVDIPILDTTLSKSGYAADAKATATHIANAKAAVLAEMEKVAQRITDHNLDKTNPHGVTAKQAGAVPEENDYECHLIAGTKNETWYRLAVTTAGNLRVDTSIDKGETWVTSHYFPKTSNGGSVGSPIITSSGRTGSLAFYNGGSAANGAGLWLYGIDHSNKGKFRLQVYDEENKKYRQLDGSVDGSLKWNGKELAKTETIELTVATQNNYTINSINAYCKAGIVDVVMSVNVAEAANAWVTIATLPSGYRPPVTVQEEVPYFKASAGYEILRFRVTNAGLIQLGFGTTGASYALHDTFVTA